MKCAHCAREVEPSTAVTVGDKTYCDNLCRFNDQKKQEEETTNTKKAVRKNTPKKSQNTVLVKNETMNKIRFAIVSLIFIVLGIWAILAPDAMEGHSAEDIKGRHQLIKFVIMYLWSIPGGLIFVAIGLLNFKANVLRKK